MRILGEIAHPRLKITLMQHGRYLLKLEDVDVEITYRFRDGEGIASLADAQRMLDLGLLQEAEQSIMQLSASRRRYQKPPEEDDDFPSII